MSKLTPIWNVEKSQTYYQICCCVSGWKSSLVSLISHLTHQYMHGCFVLSNLLVLENALAQIVIIVTLMNMTDSHISTWILILTLAMADSFLFWGTRADWMKILLACIIMHWYRLLLTSPYHPLSAPYKSEAFSTFDNLAQNWSSLWILTSPGFKWRGIAK